MSIETIDNSDNAVVNPITARQKEDVAKMRTSLLSCLDENGITTAHAIQSITVMRVYHQLTRIVKYTELMDKLEDKLYAAIDYQLDNCDISDTSTLSMLISIQEKLQKAMIDSHKLLQPYMDVQNFSVVDLVDTTASAPESTITGKLMSSESRDKVRYTAQAVLDMLGDVDNG